MDESHEEGCNCRYSGDEQRLATNNPHNLTRAHLNISKRIHLPHESSDRDKSPTKNRTQLSPKIKGATVTSAAPLLPIPASTSRPNSLAPSLGGRTV